MVVYNRQYLSTTRLCCYCYCLPLCYIPYSTTSTYSLLFCYTSLCHVSMMYIHHRQLDSSTAPQVGKYRVLPSSCRIVPSPSALYPTRIAPCISTAALQLTVWYIYLHGTSVRVSKLLLFPFPEYKLYCILYSIIYSRQLYLLAMRAFESIAASISVYLQVCTVHVHVRGQAIAGMYPSATVL